MDGILHRRSRAPREMMPLPDSGGNVVCAPDGLSQIVVLMEAASHIFRRTHLDSPEPMRKFAVANVPSHSAIVSAAR